MDAAPPVRLSIAGFIIALAGAAVFVVSSFLPFLRIDLGGGAVQKDSSFYNQMTLGFGGAERVGGLVFLFSGVVVVAVVALVGIARGSRLSWAPMALACTTVGWSLTWLGILVQERSIQFTKEIGYWGMIAGAAVALVGGIVAAVSSRRTPTVPEEAANR